MNEFDTKLIELLEVICEYIPANKPDERVIRLFNELKELNQQEIEIQEQTPIQSIKDHDRELVRQVCEKIIKFINELAWQDVKYDAFQSTMGEFSGSTSAIPRYAKKYFDLWKEMFNEDLEKIQKEYEK